MSSNIREQCRCIIAPILAAMRGEPRKAIRKALRQAWSEPKKGNRYNVWRDEVKIAMREKHRKRTYRPKAEAEIIPSMREWARSRGLTGTLAVYDVDDEPEEEPNGIFTWQNITPPAKKEKRGRSRRPPVKKKDS